MQKTVRLTFAAFNLYMLNSCCAQRLALCAKTEAIYKRCLQRTKDEKNVQNPIVLGKITSFPSTTEKLYHTLTNNVNTFSSFFTPKIMFLL